MKKWQEKLLLQQWQIGIKFQDEHDHDVCVAADVTCNLSYIRATITFYNTLFDDTIEEQERVVVHELCHILLFQYRELAIKFEEGSHVTGQDIHHANEHSTQAVTYALWNLHTGGR